MLPSAPEPDLSGYRCPLCQHDVTDLLQRDGQQMCEDCAPLVFDPAALAAAEAHVLERVDALMALAAGELPEADRREWVAECVKACLVMYRSGGSRV
jgi:hypothetical protein